MTPRRPVAAVVIALAALMLPACTSFPAPDSPPPSAVADIPVPPPIATRW